MTDGVNPSATSPQLSPNDQKKIDELLAQQEQLQTLYNQVVSHIQEHPNMPAEQMKKYKDQLKQLSEYYLKNQESLRILGYSTVKVNKNVTIKRSTAKKISIKTILIGCAGLLFFFLLGMGFLFFYLINNPEEFTGLSSFGITAVVAKNLLSGVTLTLMMMIILLGLIIVIINTYKIFTAKNKRKLWNYWGIILWVLILGIAAGAGSRVLGQISNISVDELLNPNDVLLPYVQMRPWVSDSLKRFDGKFPLLAPTNVSFSLIYNNFQKYMTKTIGQQRIDAVRLDCWNGNVLERYNQNTFFFASACFYTKKGTYPVHLIVTYTNPQTLSQKTEKFFIKNLSVTSQINLSGAVKSIIAEGNEYVIGMVPSEITFNAAEVFRDLWLSNYLIRWDADGDGIDDKLDDTSATFIYDQAKVYYPTFSLPDVSEEMLYSFPLRVEKSAIPVCKIDLIPEKVNQYQVEGFFYDDSERFIADYSFSFIDKTNGKIFDVIHDKSMGLSFPYIFPGEGIYTVKMNFTTYEGKQGTCEVDSTLIGKAGFNFDYQISQNKPNTSHFELMPIDTALLNITGAVNIVEIPTKIKFKVTKVSPQTPNITQKVFFDDNILVSNANEEYIFDIKDTADHMIKVVLEDKGRGLHTEQEIPIHVVLEDIVWSLLIVWDAVGYEPLQVELDASATKINNDFWDEIVYFSWDFGDGNQKQNLTNGVIEHRYIYDHAKNNGMFYPSVVVTTKKWRSKKITSSTAIVVKKQLIQLTINSVSHPSQEARVGENMKFSLNFNGMPSKIYWDFGDGTEVFECRGRDCIDMSKSYQEKGRYLIKVKMDLEDQQSVEQTMSVRIV